MKENRIKLTAVIVLALLFMLAFTCCVNKNIPSSENGEKGQVTLFTPPETTSTADSVTKDPYDTTEPLITMPPIHTGDVTTPSTPETTLPQPPETTESEDVVYDDFSGLY